MDSDEVMKKISSIKKENKDLEDEAANLKRQIEKQDDSVGSRKWKRWTVKSIDEEEEESCPSPSQHQEETWEHFFQDDDMSALEEDEESDSNDVCSRTEYRCKHPGCGKTFELPTSLTNHENTHTTKHQCPVCQTCCQSKAHLKNHLNKHSGPLICNWVGCGDRFKRKNYLEEHIKTMHSSECQDNVVEPEEDKNANQSDIKNTENKDEKEEIDENTEMNAETDTEVDEEKNNVAEDVGEDEMMVDGDQMTLSNDAGVLIENRNPGYEKISKRKVSLKMRFFLCKTCQDCFKSRGELQVHLRTHTNKRPFVCDWVGCGDRFKRKNHLNEHQSFAHSDDHPLKCTENECDKTFKRKKHLRVHLNEHSSFRQFQCQESGCNKQYKRKSHLNEHVKYVHSDVIELLKCNQNGCDKRFKRISALNEHLKFVH